jgi:thiamine pyrophosphate-dependent acetolactate synthase large subunit-like protein
MEAYKIDIMFSIPGIHTVEFYRSLPKRNIRHVTPRHEQGAAFMAYGYGFATGRPAACMLITGPGVLNASTGIAEAYSDSVPMLVIAANNLVAEIGVGRGALHETKSQAAVQEQIAAFSHTLLEPSNVEEIFHRAMSLLDVGRPRPSLIDVPRDLLGALAPVPGTTNPDIHRPGPHPSAIAKAANLLSNAKRPIIIAGGGARFSSQSLRDLARKLDIPVVTTNAGKGILPETDPLSLGSSLPFQATSQAIRQADVVLAIGTELGETDLLYTSRPYEIEGQLIRIDIDPKQLTMNYKPAVAVLSDAGLAIDAILQLIAESSKEGKSRAAAIRSSVETDSGWSVESPKHKIVLDVMQDALSADAIICADSTQLAYTGNHYYRSQTPGSWLFPNGYGTLGSALPAAIGAKLGCPERQVVAIVGDGSFLYSIEELTTAVENEICLPIIVWNNRAYGEIRDAMVASDIPTVGVDLYTPDFLMIAQGFGCSAVRIESVTQLAEELRLALGRSKPTVIQIDNDSSLFARVVQ